MKTVCKTLVLLLLTLSLVFALLACTNKQEQAKEDDSWMTEDVTEKKTGTTASRQEYDSSDSAAQSSNRVTLPTIPAK